MGFGTLPKKLVSLKKFQNNFSLKLTDRLSFPERLKGTFLEKWATFWKNMMVDYTEVAKETSRDIKERPRRALTYAWGVAAWWYCVQTNPSALSFRDQVLSSSLELSSLPDSIRNKESSKHLIALESYYNDGTIRRLNLGVLSVMWVDNYDKCLGLYPAQCKYLEPKLLSFHHRIVDIGFLSRWWIINRRMTNCDVNQEEWKDN